MKYVLSLLLFSAVCLANPPTVGKILILDNGQTIEGDVERIGEEYHVRGGIGTSSIPAARVVKLCASKADALTFLRSKARPEDPDENLRLAKWCHVNNMTAEAIVELKQALTMRPNHAESKRLLQYFEQWAKPVAAKTETVSLPETPRRASDPSLSINVESMGAFTSRVQPILMNTCAKCHTSNDTAFRLVRTKGIGSSDRRAVQENVAAVLSQVHPKLPERSLLLVKAISPHGNANEAPIKGRKAPAYRLLEDWVRATLDGNPHLQDVLRPSAPVLQTLATTPEPKPSEPKLSPPPRTEEKPEAVEEPTLEKVEPQPVKPRPVEAPPPATQPESEFDATIFNKLVHPKGKPNSRPAPPRKDGE